MNNRSPVAQSVERLPVKEDVAGSSPAGGAKSYSIDFLKIECYRITMAERLDLIVPTPNGSQKVTTSHLFRISDAPFGGGDGRKYYMDLVHSGGENPLLTRLIGKEYSIPIVDMQDELWFIAQTSRELFNLGYPVPALVGYCAYRANSLLIMSDMSQSGKYLLWGYNDYPHKEEKRQLAEMGLNRKDFQQVTGQVSRWVAKLNRDGVHVGMSSYHVRRNRSTSSLDIAMLDLYHQQIGNVDISSNKMNANDFLNELYVAIESIA